MHVIPKTIVKIEVDCPLQCTEWADFFMDRTELYASSLMYLAISKLLLVIDGWFQMLHAGECQNLYSSTEIPRDSAPSGF